MTFQGFCQLFTIFHDFLNQFQIPWLFQVFPQPYKYILFYYVSSNLPSTFSNSHSARSGQGQIKLTAPRLEIKLSLWRAYSLAGEFILLDIIIYFARYIINSYRSTGWSGIIIWCRRREGNRTRRPVLIYSMKYFPLWKNFIVILRLHLDLDPQPLDSKSLDHWDGHFSLIFQ